MHARSGERAALPGRWCCQGESGSGTDVTRLQALRAAFDLEAHALPLGKGTESGGIDRGEMHEHVVGTIRRRAGRGAIGDSETMALVDFMTEPDKAQSWERRKEAVVAKLASATRTEAALVIADKGYNLRDMLRAAATSQASVDSTNRQENLVAGLQARGNLGAGESDLCDRESPSRRRQRAGGATPSPSPTTSTTPG